MELTELTEKEREVIKDLLEGFNFFDIDPMELRKYEEVAYLKFCKWIGYEL